MRTTQGRRVRSLGHRSRRARRASLLGLALAMVVATAGAGEQPPFAARAGVDLAAEAAHAWSPDAVLIYVENDEPIDASGNAERWGYLFHSPSLDKGRVYSVRDGKILVAENLEMKFEAPPLVSNWIDSGAAIEAARQTAAREFKGQSEATLTTMLLMRGAFQDKDPDETTWTLIYTAPGSPSLFVVVDAAQGKVRRLWRG
jgi:hypothetical protein